MSFIKGFDKKVTVVAHDAGAANHILAWIRAGDIICDADRLCFSGPAVESAKQLNISQIPISIGEVAGRLVDTDFLIAGTGWSTDWEHEAIRIANERHVFWKVVYQMHQLLPKLSL
mgnify:CR=1 FL=1